MLAIGTASSLGAASGAGPVASHSAISASVRAVQPALSGLFQVHAPRVWVDGVDESGLPGKNGVPDFLDSWDAFSARTSSAILRNGYAFTTIDGLQHEVLYAGVQRATAGGPSSAVLEFSQKAGERTLGDLRISVEIDAAGGIGAARFETFAGEEKGASRFLPIALLSGEGCNDAGSACLVANGALLEVGYNLTALGKPEKSFSGLRVTTPDDSVVGTFSIHAVTLPVVPCPSNLTTCTANDVTTTVKAVNILNNDLCTSLTDTIELQITTAYAATSNERFDLGLFVSSDGGTVKEPSTALICRGAAALSGQGDDLAYPDADTDLFLSIDPTGHSSTPNTTDTCGDLRASAGPVDWTVIATVDCNIVNGELRIPSCRVWEQNANHKTSCTSLQQAGTGSKCDCTDLVVTTQLNPCATTVCNDNNPCTTDTCDPNVAGYCVYTNNTAACNDNNACTTGDTCSGGTCVGGAGPNCDDNNLCTTDSCDSTNGCTHTNNTNPCNDGNACTTGDACSGGTCVGGAAPSCDDNNPCTDDTCSPTTGCVHTNNTADCGGTPSGDCDAQDKCEAGVCVEKFKASTVVCRAADGVCDVAENCTGTSATCPDDGVVPAGDNQTCRAAENECDAAEKCNGTDKTCPGDQCKGGNRPETHFCSEGSV